MIVRSLTAPSAGAENDSMAISATSHRFLKPFIAANGLQVQVLSQPTSWIARQVEFLNNLWRAERSQPLSTPPDFRFQEVSYEGMTPLLLQLQCISAERFCLFSADRKLWVEAAVGEKVSLPQCSLIVGKVPADLVIGRTYSVRIDSWAVAVKEWKKKFSLTPHKLSTSVYDLRYLHPDRERAAELLNQFMASYQRFLRKEYEDVATTQFQYLDERKNDLYTQMADAFTEHAEYVSNCLEQTGIASSEQELRLMGANYQKLLGRLFEIDVALAREDRGQEAFAGAEEFAFVTQIRDLEQKREELLRKRDLLGLALLKAPTCSADLCTNFEELQTVRQQRGALESFLARSPSLKDLPLPANAPLSLWAHQIGEYSPESPEAADFLASLRQHTHLLALRERSLQERSLHVSDVAAELEGMDLESAQKLVEGYHKQLDESEAKIRHLQHMLESLTETGLSVSAFGSLLSDSVSQHLASVAGKIIEELRDEKNHSAKEEQRLLEELDLQKKLLAEHISQLVQVEEIRQSVVREKLAGLNAVSLEGINQRIALLDTNLEEILAKKHEALLGERELLVHKMGEMRRGMKHLPEQFSLEKQLKLKTEGSLAMVRAMAQTVESHTVARRLHSISAKTLDQAIVPLFPASPYLILFSFTGAAGSTTLTAFALFLIAIAKGLPMTRERLLSLRCSVAGSLSFSCDGTEFEISHLESLRPLALSLHKTVIGILGGKGPNYSYGLAELLGRAGRKVLLLPLDFRSPFAPDEPPGLLQFLDGAALSIQSTPWYDKVSTGGNSSFGAEILQSKKFLELLEELRTQYDQILLFIRAPLVASEALAARSWSEQLVVTVCGESKEQLMPFLAENAMFITCDEEI